MNDQFREFRKELNEAGFFATSTEDMGTWNRIVPCSEGPPEALQFGGRSFWVTSVESRWYVGTWGDSAIYELTDSRRLIDFTRAFLTAEESFSEIVPALQKEFAMSPISDAEAQRKFPDGR